MIKKFLLLMNVFLPMLLQAQNVMTPELLWQLGRVSYVSSDPNSNNILYSVKHYDVNTEKSRTSYFFYNPKDESTQATNILDGYSFVQWDENGLYATKGDELYISYDQGKNWRVVNTQLKDADNIRVSPDGRWIAFSKKVQMETVLAKEKYTDLPKSSGKVYTDLNYRHWDQWSNGKVNHIFILDVDNPQLGAKDIMKNEPFDAPTQPFGGKEDLIFSPDSKDLIYVCKKKKGKNYATSTNTDLYAYDLQRNTTTNLTEGMMGYDLNPMFDPKGNYLAWKSMRRDGFEADKIDIVIMDYNTKEKINLTEKTDETVDGGFAWNKKGDAIYYNAAYRGTVQLNKINLTFQPKGVAHSNKRITMGHYDIAGIEEVLSDKILVSKTDFNHASELYLVNDDGDLDQITNVNKAIYDDLSLSTSELKMVTTTDGKQMGVWVIYPPNFNPNKKYPTLLYCQGGPQGALSQFYSFRWNFQLMAANGYIIVAPNRRGMPGWGVKWNEDISKDWGGQAIDDYLSAIDAIAKEPYVDKNKLGCVGASYGGYSVYMLAGLHEGRFKSFIAHNGLFDMRSWYGTTEELWFANWDLGGSYWEKNPSKSYAQHNPSNYVDRWNTPIMIIQGEKDFRVPIEQGLQAFQAAQLRGIKSKLLFLPDENHWVLKPQNALLWQREFFGWLKETLK